MCDDVFHHLNSMEAAHLERGFSEIAQDLTTFPDGSLAICRDLNKIPAGIKGANKYGICIENLGNFDSGYDVMTPEQKDCILSVTALLCRKFNLNAIHDNHKYHHWFRLDTGEETGGGQNTKSCPGTNFFGGNSVTAAEANFYPLIAHKLAALSQFTPAPQSVALYSAEVVPNVLNVRAMPTTDAEIVGELFRGTDVFVYEESGMWGRIDATKSKWVSTRYLNTGIHLVSYIPALCVAEVTATCLNVRESPSAAESSTILGTLVRGEDVQVYEKRNGFCRIDQKDSRWVYGDFLRVLYQSAA